MAQNVVVPPFDVAPETVVGSTPQSVFPFNFPFWNAADIIVRINGAELPSSAFTVEGFFVQNGDSVEGGFGSGQVTLNTPVSNCTVTLDRFVVDSREAQFGRSSPLPMAALNADLNKATGRDQDLARWLRRAIDEAGSSIGLIGKADVGLGNVLAQVLGAKAINAVDLPTARGLGQIGIDSGIRAEWFGAVGDSVTDDTAAIQAAIDYVTALPGNFAGGVVLFGSACYRASNLILKSRVRLRGLSYGMSQIRRIDDGLGSLVFVPKSATLVGWDNIAFDGNQNNATSSTHVIEFEATSNSSGTGFSPLGDKVTQEEYSYKMASCWSFVVGRGRQCGVYINSYNFDVRFKDYRVSHCLQHGIYNASTDSSFENGYIEQNGWSGFHNVAGATKIYGLKSIFNCRQLATPGLYANIWIGAGQGIETGMLEAQDGYGDGIYLNCSDSIILGSSNQNGYKAFGQTDQSSRIHTNLRVGSAARRLTVELANFAYKSAVGADGFYTTEWPYVLDSAATFSRFNVNYLASRFNAPPQGARVQIAGDPLLAMSAWNSSTTTFFDTDPFPSGGGTVVTRRNYRNSPAGTSITEIDYVPGTSTVRHSRAGSGDTQMNANGVGNVVMGGPTGGAWNTTHLVVGTFHLWFDGSGVARVKNGAPTSATDGTVLGSQS